MIDRQKPDEVLAELENQQRSDGWDDLLINIKEHLPNLTKLNENARSCERFEVQKYIKIKKNS